MFEQEDGVEKKRPEKNSMKQEKEEVKNWKHNWVKLARKEIRRRRIQSQEAMKESLLSEGIKWKH